MRSINKRIHPETLDASENFQSHYFKSTIETLDLVQRLFVYLKDSGDMNLIVNFLSQIEAKANYRIAKQQNDCSSVKDNHLAENLNSPQYWRGVRDIAKKAKFYFLKDTQHFSQYLSDIKDKLLVSHDHLQKTGKDILPITSLIVKGGKISVIGLDRAGKTTLLQRLKTGRYISDTIPTIGMNCETLHINNVKFFAWDIGGQLQFKNSLWEPYTKGSVGLIYVIDANNTARFPEARRTLDWMLQQSHLASIPVAIFANKNDLLQERSVVYTKDDYRNILGITKKLNRHLEIFSTSAKTGESLIEGIYWLTDAIMLNLGG
ncbi:MAG: ADP-ribosylation factor family protein [Candidatus Kariarchaeaceae archaeon]|jgi:small GTP-binding protein